MADFEDYFDKPEGEVRRIAIALRDCLDAEIPRAERKLAWGYPCWSVGGHRVASVIAHKDRCNLQLFRGAELAARFSDRIEGTGAALRHVKVRSASDVDEKLREIVRAALALEPQSKG